MEAGFGKHLLNDFFCYRFHISQISELFVLINFFLLTLQKSKELNLIIFSQGFESHRSVILKENKQRKHYIA